MTTYPAMTSHQRDVYRILRKACREGRLTPTQKAMAKKLGRTESSIGNVIQRLRKAGHFQIKYDGYYGIDSYGMEINGALYWSKAHSQVRKERRETSMKVACEYGATKIAFMEPDEREEEIAKLYNERYKNMTKKEFYALKHGSGGVGL